jgi:hypothetical protein
VVKDFREKNNVITLEHPHTLVVWLQLIFSVPSTEISIERTALLWRYWHHYESDGRAEKFFIKRLSGMFPIHWLPEMYNCARGLFWRKFSLNDCNVLYLSEIKWFQEYFELPRTNFLYIQ